MKWLTDHIEFPPVENTSEEGILAIGGDLSTERLMLAYRSGIFPWYESGQPILWWSPEERMVLFPKEFKISKSLQKTLRSKFFTVTFNKNFEEVIRYCATTPREGQAGTWITSEMQKAYIQLHKEGHAISVEVWENNKMVGGLYGIDLPEKKIFCGESMFAHSSDASKVGFSALVSRLTAADYQLIDCQVYTSHLERLGAVEISREVFQSYLNC